MRLPAGNEAKQTVFSLVPDAMNAGARLDSFLASNIEGWSRSRLVRLIEDEDVLVNGKRARSSYKVREGDEIEVELTELPATHFEPEDIDLDIVYEDDILAVINKPAGMVVHPGAGVTHGTLANAVAYRFSLVPHPSSAALRLGIVHRLDKDTSGLIVVAKDETTAESLSRQFHDRAVEKSYVALVHGVIDRPSGTIEAPIARDPHNRVKMKVASHGRHALTLWKVSKRYEKFTLLDVDIKTGRTHQIRVHLGSINHPVVGDQIYNAGRDKTVADLGIRKSIAQLRRFFLHAQRLAFTHPATGERMTFNQPLPSELSQFLQLL